MRDQMSVIGPRSRAGTTCDVSMITAIEQTNTTPAAETTNQVDKL